MFLFVMSIVLLLRKVISGPWVMKYVSYKFGASIRIMCCVLILILIFLRFYITHNKDFVHLTG